ncbi:hypothetical protein OZK63_00140 [Streptomyces sp. UMAF16]|uniref:hypothetical protein n=1 Tax=Streptomyces achromogenes TaxID=67255 RepID=UPI0022835F3A|nr:hypothetical protein [Streptomyces sp. UMAF16]
MSDEKVGKKADVRDEQAVKQSVERASSEILDILAVKGEVTQSGAVATSCTSYPEEDEVHRMRHPWSVYGVPGDDLEKAMDRLRAQLPAKGWKIVKDGPDKSRAKLPQIVANSSDGRLSADLRLWREPADSKRSSMIEVTVVSDCFRSKPDGTTPTG